MVSTHGSNNNKLLTFEYLANFPEARISYL